MLHEIFEGIFKLGNLIEEVVLPELSQKRRIVVSGAGKIMVPLLLVLVIDEVGLIAETETNRFSFGFPLGIIPQVVAERELEHTVVVLDSDWSFDGDYLDLENGRFGLFDLLALGGDVHHPAECWRSSWGWWGLLNGDFFLLFACSFQSPLLSLPGFQPGNLFLLGSVKRKFLWCWFGLPYVYCWEIKSVLVG